MMGECCLVTPRSRKSSERPGAPGIYLALRRLTEPRVTIEGVLLTCTSGTVLPSSRFVLSTPSSWPKQGIPMKKRICSPQICGSALLLAVLMVLSSAPAVAQSVPPTSPTGLTATAASCGQVNLSWSAPTDNSGTGLKAYSRANHAHDRLPPSLFSVVYDELIPKRPRFHQRGEGSGVDLLRG